MKKLFKILLIFLVLITAAGVLFLMRYGDALGINLKKPSPEKYVIQAVTYMDSQGIYASGEEWEALKADVLERAKQAKSYDECHELIEEALKAAGGKHSKLIVPSGDAADAAEMPLTEMIDGNILYVKLPQFSGNDEEGMAYAGTVYEALKNNRDVISAVIIDVRGNHGGDMGPMAAGVSPLLPDGDLMYFDIKGMRIPVTLESGTVSGGGSTVTMEDPFKLTGLPVMILQDEETASSAEALLICFMGCDNVTFLGSPSAGYCSCNNTRKLYDGAVMLLTIGKDVSRDGREFCEDPILPDVITDTPYEDALDKIERMTL